MKKSQEEIYFLRRFVMMLTVSEEKQKDLAHFMEEQDKKLGGMF